ncbi:hypothetical protein GW7_11433 [Heterocephalus glaber]|uniref:Uncharacterized protein n=1 Tax=Heterocephalus glaber TaxID=10181 RepID=G5B0G9_HETGA|nr:hypothetical protein GW7_11433 [Heterocephalus glaber]
MGLSSKGSSKDLIFSSCCKTRPALQQWHMSRKCSCVFLYTTPSQTNKYQEQLYTHAPPPVDAGGVGSSPEGPWARVGFGQGGGRGIHRLTLDPVRASAGSDAVASLPVAILGSMTLLPTCCSVGPVWNLAPGCLSSCEYFLNPFLQLLLDNLGSRLLLHMGTGSQTSQIICANGSTQKQKEGNMMHRSTVL